MRQKKFSQEQIIGILKEAEKDGTVVGDVCQTHGILENSFYRWRRKYVGLDVQEARRLRELEKENARLKTIVANRDLEIEAVKELLRKNS